MLLSYGETDELAWHNIGLPVTAEEDELGIWDTLELAEKEAILCGHFRILLGL